MPALRLIKRRAIFKSFSTRIKKSSSFQKEGETCRQENQTKETNNEGAICGANNEIQLRQTNDAIQQEQ